MPPIFWAIKFDLTVHLSDLITTVIVPVTGFAVARMYRVVRTFVRNVGNIGDVVDEHTEVLTKAGWLKGRELPKVGPRRRL